MRQKAASSLTLQQCRYAKLTINGEVLYEVDLINMVEIVDGVDLMEAHRNALGL
ncbi:phage major tail tube protein [Klebsiella pneumoniae]|uniref:phage major tail tube protein n=1 Tax=Klebsiella pneumoniae TaxID=573 RepID=UPI00311E53AF